MPAGIGYPPPMGGANPANLQAMAEAGDPRAIAMLRQMQGGGMPPGGGAGGAGMPQGGLPPMQGAGAAPGMAPAAPAGQMSQADFSGYGREPAPDAAAQKAAQQVQLLRMLAARERGGQ
jgi:hypothetical protein